MTTSIALQNLHSEGTEGLRHRTNQASNHEAEDHELTIDLSSPSALSTPTFTPTHTLWLTPHSMFTKSIPILDLTPTLNSSNVPYTSFDSAYKAAVKSALKDHAHVPRYICKRENWMGLRWAVTAQNAEENEVVVANWKHPWSSVGEALLSFPEGSPHSSHEITLKNKVWGLRTETFVLNSVPYEWRMESLLHSHEMALYKIFPSISTLGSVNRGNERKTVVARYSQKWWGGFVTGGVVVVDSKEVDVLVAVLTLAVVLKKKRQRAAERGGGGGNGGGGE